MAGTSRDSSEADAKEYLESHLNTTRYRSNIYKVPERLLNLREEAYTPRIVTIGPFHRHGAPHLQPSESYKIQYANTYISKLSTTATKPRVAVMGQLVEKAKEWEEEARASYDCAINLSSNEFVCMILMDGIFILEFLLQNSKNKQGLALAEEIFQKEWIYNEILHDLMLLENQIPFFVVKNLFELPRQNIIQQENITLLGLVKSLFVPQVVQPLGNSGRSLGDGYHLVDILLQLMDIPSGDPKPGKLVNTFSAVELKQAGVKFAARGIEGGLFNISFHKNKGILEIPRLQVNQWTDSLLGNLNAYQRCRYNGSTISSYIILMENLMQTCEDVDLLVTSEIIENKLASSEMVRAVFNNLHKKTALDNHKFWFSELCKDLNEYSRDPLHQCKQSVYKWTHMLQRDYFSNPWSTISVVAAVILLILTAIQTICSLLALKQPQFKQH